MENEDIEESPFRSDEPVSGSAKWLWLGASGGTVCVMVILALRLSEGGHSARIVSIAPFLLLHIYVLALMFRAARFTSRCQGDRSFEAMASALRAQGRFWIVIAVLGILNLLTVLWLTSALHDSNARARRFMDHKADEPDRSDVF